MGEESVPQYTYHLIKNADHIFTQRLMFLGYANLEAMFISESECTELKMTSQT